MSNTDKVRNEIIDLLPCHAKDIPNCETPTDCWKCKPMVDWANQILSIKELRVEAETKTEYINHESLEESLMRDIHDFKHWKDLESRKAMAEHIKGTFAMYGFVKCEPKGDK